MAYMDSSNREYNTPWGKLIIKTYMLRIHYQTPKFERRGAKITLVFINRSHPIHLILTEEQRKYFTNNYLKKLINATTEEAKAIIVMFELSK